MDPKKYEAESVADVADFFEVTKQTVYNWLKNDGLPFVDTPRGKSLNLRVAVKWHRGFESRSGVKSVKLAPLEEAVHVVESFDDALARKTRAEADLKELQLAEKRGLVASIEDVEKAITAANLATRTQIEAVPARLAMQLVGVPDRNTAFQLLNREMSQLMTNLATIEAVMEERRDPSDGDDD